MNFMCYGIDIGWTESCQIEKFVFFFLLLFRLLKLREKIFYVGNWKGDCKRKLVKIGERLMIDCYSLVQGLAL